MLLFTCKNRRLNKCFILILYSSYSYSYNRSNHVYQIYSMIHCKKLSLHTELYTCDLMSRLRMNFAVMALCHKHQHYNMGFR